MYEIPTITGLSKASPVLPSNNLIFPGCCRSKIQSLPLIFRAFINLSFINTRDASAPCISSKGTTLNLLFRCSAANPKSDSNICPTFILEGTPNGLRTKSTGVPSGK